MAQWQSVLKGGSIRQSHVIVENMGPKSSPLDLNTGSAFLLAASALGE